jgi:hypothetical protein
MAASEVDLSRHVSAMSCVTSRYSRPPEFASLNRQALCCIASASLAAADRERLVRVTMTQRPQETLQQLCEIFPDFDKWWTIKESPVTKDGLVDGVFHQWTHHRVM